MRRLPSFHALRAFESAARLESFLLAAAELHLTPSAISHQIRGLEEHFGRQLFVRKNRQLELTTEARKLMPKLAGPFEAAQTPCDDPRPGPRIARPPPDSPPSSPTERLRAR